MQISELQWLIGVAVTVVFAMAGIAIGSFRSMTAKLDTAVEKLSTAIRDGDKELAGSMKSEDDRLHERLNRVRDEYVPRRELDDHMRRIDDRLTEIREDQKNILKALSGR